MTASARITTIQIYDSRNQHSYDGDDDGADNGAVNAANAAVNVAEGREPVKNASQNASCVVIYVRKAAKTGGETKIEYMQK